MFIASVSTASELRELWKRKGGGGGSHGSSGGSSRGSSGSSKGSGSGRGGGSRVGGIVSSSGGSEGNPTGFTHPGDANTTPTRATSEKAQGDLTVYTIGEGQKFAGKTIGGGTRGGVTGDSMYGSGYVNKTILKTRLKGTTGEGFPYYFWPVSYGECKNHPSYICNTEYGKADDEHRPGGPQHVAEIRCTQKDCNFRILADKDTVTSLVASINKMPKKCKKLVEDPEHITTQAYLGPDNGKPVPEEALLYFRASSVALFLEGYNNSATFTREIKMREPPFDMVVDWQAQDTPLPPFMDKDLQLCLVQTIADKVPLVNGATPTGPEMGVLSLAWLLVVLHLLR